MLSNLYMVTCQVVNVAGGLIKHQLTSISILVNKAPLPHSLVYVADPSLPGGVSDGHVMFTFVSMLGNPHVLFASLRHGHSQKGFLI